MSKTDSEEELAIRALLYEDAKAEKVGASYPGNLGAVEMVRFYQESTPQQQSLMDKLLDSDKLREAWELLKRVTGVKLHDLPGYRQAAGPYEGIDFKPPESVANAAAKGLEYRQKASPSNRGGLTTEEAGKQGIGSGVQRATNLKNRTNVSPKVISQMVAFFSRHEKNKGVAAEHKGEPWNDKGHVAWLLWGGDPGKAWAEKVKGQMEAADAKKASLFFTSADLTVGPHEVQKAALEAKLPPGWKKAPASGSYIIYESPSGLVRVQDTKRAGHPMRYQVLYQPVSQSIVQDGKRVERTSPKGQWLEVDDKSSLAAALALGVQTEAHMKQTGGKTAALKHWCGMASTRVAPPGAYRSGNGQSSVVAVASSAAEVLRMMEPYGRISAGDIKNYWYSGCQNAKHLELVPKGKGVWFSTDQQGSSFVPAPAPTGDKTASSAYLKVLEALLAPLCKHPDDADQVVENIQDAVDETLKGAFKDLLAGLKPYKFEGQDYDSNGRTFDDGGSYWYEVKYPEKALLRWVINLDQTKRWARVFQNPHVAKHLVPGAKPPMLHGEVLHAFNALTKDRILEGRGQPGLREGDLIPDEMENTILAYMAKNDLYEEDISQTDRDGETVPEAGSLEIHWTMRFKDMKVTVEEQGDKLKTVFDFQTQIGVSKILAPGDWGWGRRSAAALGPYTESTIMDIRVIQVDTDTRSKAQLQGNKLLIKWGPDAPVGSATRTKYLPKWVAWAKKHLEKKTERIEVKKDWARTTVNGHSVYDLEGKEQVAAILTKIRQDVQPILKQFGLVFTTLSESVAEGSLGFNRGARSISLNVRQKDKPMLLRKYSAIMATMLHELAHLRHMNHGPQFKLFEAELVAWARAHGIYAPGPVGSLFFTAADLATPTLKTAKSNAKTAGDRSVENYKNLHAYWDSNPPGWRIYGVFERDLSRDDMDLEVGRLLLDKNSLAWTVEVYPERPSDRIRKKVETFTAKDPREGVKRGLMALHGYLARNPLAKVAKSNAKIVEVPANFHQVELQKPKAINKEFPFEGFIDFQGIEIDVENAKGSTRSGEGPEGPWTTEMFAHYGEIRGTEGTDGDKLDVYVGDNHDSSLVVVIHQHNPWDGQYDEDKVVLGCDSIEEAIGLYKKQYDRPGFFKDKQYTAMPIGAFWRWVNEERNKGKRVKMAASAEYQRLVKLTVQHLGQEFTEHPGPNFSWEKFPAIVLRQVAQEWANAHDIGTDSDPQIQKTYKDYVLTGPGKALVLAEAAKYPRGKTAALKWTAIHRLDANTIKDATWVKWVRITSTGVPGQVVARRMPNGWHVQYLQADEDFNLKAPIKGRPKTDADIIKASLEATAGLMVVKDGTQAPAPAPKAPEAPKAPPKALPKAPKAPPAPVFTPEEQRDRETVSKRTNGANPFLASVTGDIWQIGFAVPREPGVLWWTGGGFKNLDKVRAEPETFKSKAEAEHKVRSELVKFIKDWRSGEQHLVMGWDGPGSPKTKAPKVKAPAPEPKANTFTADEVTSFLRSMSTQRGGRNRSAYYDTSHGPFWSAEPNNRERLDHYVGRDYWPDEGDDPEGWDQDGWEEEYAGPLRQEVQDKLDARFGKGVLTADIGEKGHINVHLDTKGRSLMKTAQHWNTEGKVKMARQINAIRTEVVFEHVDFKVIAAAVDDAVPLAPTRVEPFMPALPGTEIQVLVEPNLSRAEMAKVQKILEQKWGIRLDAALTNARDPSVSFGEVGRGPEYSILGFRTQTHGRRASSLTGTPTVLGGLLAILRAMAWNHQTSHWQVAGDTFYGDHLLFERMYDKVVEETDGLAEKLVGLLGSSAVDAVAQADLMSRVLRSASEIGCPFQRGLQIERAFQAMVKQSLDALEAQGALSLGLDDMLRTMANDHETHIYLLQQRLGKMASVRGPQKHDPVLRLATQYVLRQVAAKTWANQ